MSAHWAAEKALFGAAQGYVAFFYPPPYLLIRLPLALAPYFWSLAAWLGATGYAFFRVARGFLPGLDPVALLAFPAVFINAAHGQNGFLSAALVGGGFLLVDRRPALAGLCFGAMAFKPQLVLMLPLALLFARRWTTFALAAAAAAAFCWLSCFVFGARAWSGFFADSALARAAWEDNLIGCEKMQSVFAAVRLLHGPVGLAYVLQGLAALAAATTLYALERRAFRGPAEAPAAICACLVSSPFLLDYDLTLLFVPLAWLTAEGLRGGFRPYEKAVLGAGYLLPVISRPVAGALGLPLAPLTVVAIFTLVVRRSLAATSACAVHRTDLQAGPSPDPGVA